MAIRAILRHPAPIVLEALLAGQRVSLGDYTYVWQDNELWIVGTKYMAEDFQQEEVLLSAHKSVSLDHFIRQCEKLPFDEVFLIGAQTAMTKMKTPR